MSCSTKHLVRQYWYTAMKLLSSKLTPRSHHGQLTLFPSFEVNWWKTRCGNASDIVPTLGMSCLIIVLERVKLAVGPYGRWHTTRPSACVHVWVSACRLYVRYCTRAICMKYIKRETIDDNCRIHVNNHTYVHYCTSTQNWDAPRICTILCYQTSTNQYKPLPTSKN